MCRHLSDRMAAQEGSILAQFSLHTMRVSMLPKSVSCHSNPPPSSTYFSSESRETILTPKQFATKKHPLYLPIVDEDQTDVVRNGPTQQGRQSKSFDTRGAPERTRRAVQRSDGDDCRRRLMMLEGCYGGGMRGNARVVQCGPFIPPLTVAARDDNPLSDCHNGDPSSGVDVRCI